MALAHKARQVVEVVLASVLCVAHAACIYDSENRCGPDQVIELGTCVCEPGFRLVLDETNDGGMCEPCGANQIGVGQLCVCEDGYTDDGQGTCTLSAQGRACDDVAICDDPVHNYCHRPEAGSPGYCTASGCVSSADCLNGYACSLEQSPSFCEQPPSGLGKPCSSQGDCAGLEADFCEMNMTNTCLVTECDEVNDDCFEGWKCCSLPVAPVTFCFAGDTCPQI